MFAIKLKVEEPKMEGKKVVCALMFDEMAIRKHVEFDEGSLWLC